jgi:hypothetical protein
MRTMWNKIQKNKIETHVCNSVCLHTSPKLDKLLVGIGDLEVAKTCTLSLQYALHQSLDACVGPLQWVHLHICQWYNDDIFKLP